MPKFTKLIAGFGPLAIAVAGLYATPAAAQATRTWVSGVGDDANPCSRTAPCKTFAGAISKTAAGGEINCLDPGGFGAVTITKSLSIICQYTEGGILTTLGTSGVIVNAGANDVIHLRGLDIQGVGTALNGIRFIAGGSLHVEDTLIRGMGAANGLGISFKPSAASELYVTNTTILANGAAGSGGGILIQPTGFGSSRVALINVRVQNNLNFGLSIDTTGNTGTGNSVTVRNSQFDGNVTGVNVNQPAGGAAAALLLVDSTVNNNSGTGINVNGTLAQARVGNTDVFANGTGLAGGTGNLLTYGDNRVNNNLTAGAFTGPTGKQ